MTLRELLQLMKHFWALCVILPIVCAAGFALYYFHTDNTIYPVASSYITTTNPEELATINGAAKAVTRECTANDPLLWTEAKAESSSQTVTITAIGPDEESTLRAANELASSAVERASALFDDEEYELSASIQPALLTQAKVSSKFPYAYVIIALLAGLFVAICIVTFIEIVRSPVKNADNLVEASNLPVVGELPGDTGEYVLANARLASNDADVHKLLVVPARKDDSAKITGALIEKAAQGESETESEARGGSVVVSTCEPLQQDAAGIYAAREADAVLVAVSQWADGREDVQAAVSQLKLIGANVVGCVLVGSAAKHSAAE